MSPIAIPHTVDPVATLKAESATKAAPTELRAFAHFDNTPGTGTEFLTAPKNGAPVLAIKDVLGDEAKLAALGRLVSERGVVFFRDSAITPEEQRTLVQALGRAGGKPATSGLHVHPLTTAGAKDGDEISVVSNKYVFGEKFRRSDAEEIRTRGYGHAQWHQDITFEPVPSDYATLVIRTLPSGGGGDTLWASAYEAYDRLSPALQGFLEGLTAVHVGELFLRVNAANGNEPMRSPRGAPENVGQDLTATHPVIRTNPVTGWKGLFVNKGFTKRIVELTQPESDTLLAFLFDHVAGNHDIQVRFRWEENSLAIWDNRSAYHAATPDLDGATREGTRSVSLGERPYFDPKSKSRREDLAQRAREGATA